MPEKIISIRLTDEDIKMLTELKEQLKKDYCIECNTSRIIKFCLHRTYAQIVPD